MFIKKSTYHELLDCKSLNIELEKEIKKLEYMLNIKDTTCKVGPWCENCEHWVIDKSEIISSSAEDMTLDELYYGLSMPTVIGGEIGYCNKYLHTLCPDFKRKGQEKKQ